MFYSISSTLLGLILLFLAAAAIQHQRLRLGSLNRSLLTNLIYSTAGIAIVVFAWWLQRLLEWALYGDLAELARSLMFEGLFADYLIYSITYSLFPGTIAALIASLVDTRRRRALAAGFGFVISTSTLDALSYSFDQHETSYIFLNFGINLIGGMVGGILLAWLFVMIDARLNALFRNEPSSKTRMD